MCLSHYMRMLSAETGQNIPTFSNILEIQIFALFELSMFKEMYAFQKC